MKIKFEIIEPHQWHVFYHLIQVWEETQRRIEVSENFQKTMDELGTLMTAHSSTNSKLKDENALVEFFFKL